MTLLFEFQANTRPRPALQTKFVGEDTMEALEILRPKYSIGDVVYSPVTEKSAEYLTCPDCLGAGKWPIKSPAGEDYELPCHRCKSNGFGSSSGKLEVYKAKGLTRRLTIGSVRTDTAATPTERISYMCIETGIGSGSIYYEHKLFSDEQSALVAANIQADEETARVRAQPGMRKLEELYTLPSVAAETTKERHKRYEVESELEALKNEIIDLEDNDYKFSAPLTAKYLREISNHLIPADDPYREGRS